MCTYFNWLLRENRCLVGRMRPAGRTLPRPALDHTDFLSWIVALRITLYYSRIISSTLTRQTSSCRRLWINAGWQWMSWKVTSTEKRTWPWWRTCRTTNTTKPPSWSWFRQTNLRVQRKGATLRSCNYSLFLLVVLSKALRRIFHLLVHKNESDDLKMKFYWWISNIFMIHFRSGPMAGRTAVFNRESVFIFGHNLANANLMDFVTSSDEFYIDWVHPDKSGFVS